MKKEKSSIPVLFLTALIITVFFVSCAVPPQPAGEKVYDLQYQLDEGTKFVFESSGEVNSVTDQMGTEVVADIYGDAEDIYVVVASNKDKGLTLELEFGDRSQDVDSAAGSDSTDFSELIGEKVKFVLLPNGKVEGFEGFGDLPEISTVTGEELNVDTYELGVKATFPLLPDRPIKIGDAWTDNQILDIPSGGSILKLENNTTYTLIEETVKDGYDCLKIEMKGTSKLSGDFEQGGTPLTIERDSTSTGTLYFAHKEGMFISTDSESIAEGIIHVPSAGIDIPQTMTTKGIITVKIEK